MEPVLGLNDLFARLEYRTAETPAASTVHHPFGSPSGPGLFHVKGLQLPAYIQNVAHAFRRKGLSESEAIQRAIGVVKDWAAGRAPGGGHVHPDVQAAAVKAVAEWEAAKAAAHGKRFNPYHAPPGAGGGEFTSAGGAGKGKASGGHAKGTSQAPSHGQGPKGTAGKSRAGHKAHLLAQAKQDRAKAHELQQELKTLEHQHAQHVKAGKQAAKTAHHHKISPHAKHRNPGHKHQHPAQHHKHQHQAKAKSLMTRITDLRKRIRVLLTAAASLEAQAKHL